MASYKKELYWAEHRLEVAEQRLGQLGPLSKVRRKGRDMKRSTVEQISKFTDDVRTAEAKIAHWDGAGEDLRPGLDERPQWDADHHWPDSRLRTVDVELAELTEPAHRTATREASLVRPARGRNQPAWLDRVAEIAPPAGSGPDAGYESISDCDRAVRGPPRLGGRAISRPRFCVSAGRRQAVR